MITFLFRRVLVMIPTMVLISIVSFIIIQLPPGDYLTSHISRLSETGQIADDAEIASLKKRYGLDQPMFVQYLKWMWGVLRGDLGQSFEWNMAVSKLIWERILLTVIISFATLLFTWAVSIPIGIYSATHQYSLFDYSFTFIGFIGLATPNFLLALVLMFVAWAYFGHSVGGLFSPEYVEAAWSFAKALDLLKHLWIPVVVVGTAGTAGLIRIMRGNLLDELRKQYVITATAKGLPQTRLLFKYPVRVAINPFVSTVGWLLPELISGAIIASVVLSLPTTGPLLLGALRSQDMFLAGAFVLILSWLTVVGTLISDVLLALVDPRIRFGAREDA